MRPLRATECISPAIDRTRLILFAPFRTGRTWKLCAAAYVCRMGTIYLPFPLIYLAFIPAILHKGTFLVATLGTAVLVFTALWTWIFHLGSRLQFAYFDITVNHGQFVAPAWRKYRAQSLAWTGFKIATGLVITILTALPIAAFVRHLIPVFLAMPKPGQPQDPRFALTILSIYAAYFGLILAFGFIFLVFSLLSDFIVPSLALENTGIQEAFRRMAELIRAEPGQFALYTLLKVLLGMVGYMGAVLAWEIAFFLLTLIVGIIVFLIGFLLHLAGIPHVILIILGILAAIVWYAVALLSMMFAVGPVLTYLDAYALYFLGGRYPLLGDLLDQSTPLPPAPPAYPAPYPAYPPPPPAV
jgi:hypothetical protein